MSALAERMALICATLAARCPARIVTRSLLDFSLRQPADLKRGIYTLVSVGESGFENLRERRAMDGTQRMLLIGQIQLGEKADPEEIEDAEFDMVEELKGFMRNLPPALICLEMQGYRQSVQTDHPYGWISADLELHL